MIENPKIVLQFILREAMQSQKISVRDLAIKSGVPIKTIYHWLTGQEPRKIANAYRVARVLGLSMDELFYGERKLNGHLPTSKTAYKAVTVKILKDGLQVSVD